MNMVNAFFIGEFTCPGSSYRGNCIYVKNCIMHGEIIEDYPDDFPHPSCLIFGYTVNEKVIHAVVSLDVGNDSIGIITVYFPNTDKFEDDLKTRKGR